MNTSLGNLLFGVGGLLAGIGAMIAFLKIGRLADYWRKNSGNDNKQDNKQSE